jgi:hypothetical protein
MVETLPLFTGTVEMMIGLLQTCIDTGRSASIDAFADSVGIWYYVHGLVALPTTITSFAWPDHTTPTSRRASPTSPISKRHQPGPNGAGKTQRGVGAPPQIIERLEQPPFPACDARGHAGR